MSVWKVTAMLSSIATMVMYAETMLIPAIPDLIADFDISYGTSSWILSVYLISGAVMTPICGKLSDMYGKKKMLLIIMIIYTAGVAAGGFANNIYLLLAVRAVQGLGISMFPIAFGVVREQFPKERIAVGQGIITSMFAAGAVIGLVAGGNIIEMFGWQATFFSILPVAIALLIVISKYIHADASMQESIKNIDVRGAATLAAAIVSFLLALTYLEGGSTTATVLGFFAMTGISLALFIIVERKAASPLVNFKLMLHRTILPANIMIMIVGLSMFMVFQTVPVLVRSPVPSGFGESVVSTAHVQLPFALVLLVFGPTSGFIISRLGSLKPIIGGSVISALGFFSLVFFHSSEMTVSLNLAVIATGLSLTNVGVMNVLIFSTPKEHSGTVFGMSSLIRIVGSSIGPALAGMYMQANQSRINVQGVIASFPSPESYTLIFITAAVLSLVSVALSILLRSRAYAMKIE
jgi:MFS family permease